MDTVGKPEPRTRVEQVVAGLSERIGRAAAHSILIAPGGIFCPEGPAGPPMMRVNVAYLSDPRFARFMREEIGGG